MGPRDTDSADTRERLQAALADRYVIGGELGRGGMGAVYRARDLRHRRSVALKVLAPEFSESLGVGRFLREIEVAAGLAHPHIVALHDSDTDPTRLWPFCRRPDACLRKKLLEREVEAQNDIRRARAHIGNAARPYIVVY